MWCDRKAGNMRILFLYLLLFRTANAAADAASPVYKIAWQAPRGADAVLRQFNESFDYVGRRLGATFEITPFLQDTRDLTSSTAARPSCIASSSAITSSR